MQESMDVVPSKYNIGQLNTIIEDSTENNITGTKRTREGCSIYDTTIKSTPPKRFVQNKKRGGKKSKRRRNKTTRKSRKNRRKNSRKSNHFS